MVLRLDLSTSKAGVDIKTTPLASISGHAIARWYERSGSRDPVMLLCDIAYILFAKEPDRVATPTGAWLGPVVNGYVKVNDENRRMIIRTVRTYIHADMLEPIRAAKLEAVA